MIRDATAEDWPAIWPIYSQIARAADTFSYDPAIGEDAAREMWMVRPPGRTTVAVDDDGTIAGKPLAGKLTIANGRALKPRGLWLHDETPVLRDPRLVLSGLNIRATNGVIHTIDRVLVPAAT